VGNANLEATNGRIRRQASVIADAWSSWDRPGKPDTLCLRPL